jgi:endonuclease/exonuclease/phosphatase (EEP) superfamily protein YafD
MNISIDKTFRSPLVVAAAATAAFVAILSCSRAANRDGNQPAGGPPRPISAGPAAARAGASASAPATKPADFKVATFNVLFLNRDLKALAKAIQQADADVVCLQETNAESEKSLREQLGKAYPHAFFQPDGKAGGLAFLSKAPLANVRYIPAKFGWFGAYACEAKLDGRPARIVNVHLTANVPPPHASPLNLAALWIKREAVRGQEIEYILAATDANIPRLIAGDFNALPKGAAPSFMRDKGFIDSLAAACKDHETLTTWSDTLGKIRIAFRVDYVFHTGAIESAGCRVLPCDASDHSLVVSGLRWAKSISP